MPKKKTTESFVTEAKAVHGDKYDYSKTVYIKAREMVTITCSTHGDFEQMAYTHVAPQSQRGCKKCAMDALYNKSRETSEGFINKSKLIHGDKYEYSKTKYNGNARALVTIHCMTHGDFNQQPVVHLQGSGCPACSNILVGLIKRKKAANTFIKKAKRIHGDKFDYSKVNYKTAKTCVTIICPVHGEFTQMPTDHLNYRGCKQCGIKVRSDKKRKNKEVFIDEAKLKHNNKYNYERTIYVTTNNKVDIFCPEPNHGVFQQRPADHLNGQGCPLCTKYGFRAEEDGFVYILKSKCNSYIKVGISNNYEYRINRLVRRTPFEFDFMHKFPMSGYDALDIENKWHKILPTAGFTGFDGCTEWFHINSVFMSKIKELKLPKEYSQWSKSCLEITL